MRNQFQQPSLFERLGSVVVTAHVETALPVPLHGVGGDGDDRLAKAAGAQLAGRGVAVLHRHLHVEQHDVERLAAALGALDDPQRVIPVDGHLDLGPGLLDELLGEEADLAAVVDNEHAAIGQVGHARRDPGPPPR